MRRHCWLLIGQAAHTSWSRAAVRDSALCVVFAEAELVCLIIRVSELSQLLRAHSDDTWNWRSIGDTEHREEVIGGAQWKSEKHRRNFVAIDSGK
ncbi:unnamed protein product [Mesocestoides corti]|uniref:Uncharacterized protein n=1 Tax=Mesocestoides corti TaxID=53468 RepID=A0A0R3UBL5_MESCO|nr:unnamed protein product [Mesocestoides corti]